MAEPGLGWSWDHSFFEAKYPAYPALRLFGDEAMPLPVWVGPAASDQWTDVEAPLGVPDLSNPPPDVRQWRYWERCDPRAEREFQRHLDEWDHQLREIQAGKRAHLDTRNQLTYDLADMTRDDRGRIQPPASSEPTFTRSARLRLWIRN